MTTRMSSPRLLDDGTETPDDDDVVDGRAPIEGAERWSALYSLEEDENGYAIATFDCHGRALRPHPLDDGRYRTPGAAFEAIRRWESAVLLSLKRPLARAEDERLTAEAAERSA